MLKPLFLSILIALAILLNCTILIAKGIETTSPKVGLKQETGPAQDIKQPNSGIPAVSPSQTNKEEQITNQHHPSWTDHWLWKDINWSGVAQVLVAVVGLIFLWRTLDGVKLQGEAAKTSADAALKTAESLIRTEQAYVFAKVQQMHVNEHGNGAITIAAQIQFWNYEKTPAIPIRGLWAVRETANIPESLAHADHNVPDWHEGLTIAPEKSISITCALSVSHERLMDLRCAKSTLYVAGRLEYRDVFNSMHETGFCWQYVPSAEGDFICTRESPLNRLT
jgi:hypothetical protein